MALTPYCFRQRPQAATRAALAILGTAPAPVTHIELAAHTIPIIPVTISAAPTRHELTGTEIPDLDAAIDAFDARIEAEEQAEAQEYAEQRAAEERDKREALARPANILPAAVHVHEYERRKPTRTAKAKSARKPATKTKK